ncbi:MAG: sigma-54-dependent Fis family transcriptional regulator [Polyangiaceae bacterium]|nr:sigma-54-dependent Fis family transcriptional regulator [Polyangiaceae bacterium]
MSQHILIVDDDHATLRLIELGLRSEGFELTTVPSATEALRVLSEREVRVVLTDLNMPGMSGVELCNQVAMAHPDVPVLVITAFGSMESAISAMRSGAFDFVTKPFEIEALALAVRRAVKHHELRAEVRRLRLAVGAGEPTHDLIGMSPTMAEVRSLLTRVAMSDATVLVTGETGTGKEVAARAIHACSKRSSSPFVAVNCAALPEALLEAELVGHVRGAFTDARVSRTGLLVSASGGTLFLDEIGDLPLGLQPKLLRIVEQRQVRPIGSNTEVPFDTRIIAATHRDLESAIEDGLFREDLYYRLNVLTVAMPPLRSRGGDVLLLGQHFVRQAARAASKAVQGISGSAAAALLNYPWPGNVRELRNAVERAVALTTYDSISLDDLPDKIRGYQSRHVIVAGDDLSELVPLEEVEKRYILRVLEAAGGNKSVAAQKLGVNRKTLYRKLAAYGVVDA